MPTPKFKYWPDDFDVRPASEVVELYEQGFAGAYHDHGAYEQLVDSLHKKTFADVAHDQGMDEDGKGKLSLCFELQLRFNPKELPGPPQNTGCCVSRSTVNAFTASYAYEVWHALEDPSDTVRYERWPEVVSPADQTFDHVAIYGERGHKRQGAYCGTLAKAARDYTGLVPRGKYDIPGFGTYDCTKYDDRKAARSGPNFPDEFRKWANQKHVRDLTQVKTIEEARDALANYYGLSVCSNFGTSSKRPTIKDSKGDCVGPNKRSRTWYHAMAWLGCDDREWAHKEYGGPLFLVQNSWGENMHTGPSRIYETDIHIPAGSFWITSKDASAMLKQNGSFALSNVKGFPRRASVSFIRS